MRLATIVLVLFLPLAPLGAQIVVALYGYHNNESKMPSHYQWDGTDNGGFGVQFVEGTYPKVAGKGTLVATGSDPLFTGALNLYLVEVAPLELTAPAKSLLIDKGTDLMALAEVGSGRVFIASFWTTTHERCE
jgi:hypothetical protein